ncbi:MAG: HNH endonuclease signature motif containing protein, partial [Candidatus Phosphoribacter sp.]
MGTDAVSTIDGRVEITAEGLVDVGTYGSLPSADVAALLADPDTRVRLDPMTGATAFLANRSYRPGAELARLVRARDGTCRFPGCGMPAERCDIDHAIPFPHGPTDVRNLHC